MEGLLLLLAAALGAAATGAGVWIGRRTGRPAPQKHREIEDKRDARFEAILANIDLYDGTDAGQREIEDE